VGDYTVRIYSSEPVPNLWDVVGREPLVPREYAIKNGVEALNERPVGTGPWKMVAWKRNDSMRFERYEGYWGPPPLFKRLRFQVIPEAGGRLAALRAGQVGLVDAVPPLDAGVLGREPGIKVTSSAQKLYCRIYLNARPKDKFDSGGKDGLFTDPRVRLAFNLAVNKEGIVQKIFHGYAQANASPVATVSYGYAAQEPYAYDPKRARALLAEAGWKDAGPDGVLKKDGETLTLQLLFPAKHYGQGFDETTPAVAEMLKAVGGAGGDQARRLRHADPDGDQGYPALQRRLHRLPHQQQPRRRRLSPRLDGHHPHQLGALSGRTSPSSTAPPGARWTRRSVSSSWPTCSVACATGRPWSPCTRRRRSSRRAPGCSASRP
jgi:ABC-type transport system substrate-binding protein